MLPAIIYVIEGKYFIREAASRLKGFLQDRIWKAKAGQEFLLKPKLGRFDSTFSRKFGLE